VDFTTLMIGWLTNMIRLVEWEFAEEINYL
jgi:hypothetical protein